MDLASAAAVGPFAVRIALAASGVGNLLQDRVELGWSSRGQEAVAEATWLLQRSDSGSAVAVAAALIQACLEAPVMLKVAGNAAADVAAGLLLQATASRLTGRIPPSLVARAYLWNPLAIAVCVGGLVQPWHNLAVIAAAWGGAAGRPVAAAAAMATAAALCPQSVLFAVSK
jgi:hypothetical protein